MIEELTGLPDGDESGLLPDALGALERMPVCDDDTTAGATAAAQHGGQRAQVPKAPGASTAAGTPLPQPSALEDTTAAVHDELQDLLR